MAPLSKQDQFFVPECQENCDAEQNTADFETTVNTSCSESYSGSITQDLNLTSESVVSKSCDDIDESVSNIVEESLLSESRDDPKIIKKSLSQKQEVQTDDDGCQSDESGSSFEVVKKETL